MINIRGAKKKNINKGTTKFLDTNAQFTNPKFSDGVAGVNNISGKATGTKIALPEEFTAEKIKQPKNEQVEYLKSETPLKPNNKKVIQLDKKILKDFDIKPSAADRLDHEIYKYENQITQQKLQAISLLDDIVNRTQQYIKLFSGISNNSIFQNLVGLAARVIAPPPTANEILVIQDRIKRLDPFIITDVFTISQIVQSPELLAYLKNLYEHVKNNVATSKDLEYILNIVKPIIDYIAINSDKFTMSGSPWLLEAYNKIKGTIFNAPTFTPGTAAPVPVQTAETVFNFQSDTTAPPMERHTDAPTQTQTTEAPITSPPMQPPQYDPETMSREPLRGNMPVIYEAYTDAFTTREKLEMFYNNLLGVGLSRSFMQIKQYIDGYPITAEQMKETPTATLTNNLMRALHYIGAMPFWAIDELQQRATVINNDPSFFFQPVRTSPEQNRVDIQDYSELKKEIYKALENRSNLVLFIMDTIYKPDYLKSYTPFKNNIIKETKAIDSKQIGGEEALAEKVETKIFFDIIYNSLILLNESSLSDFISTIGNEMNILMNDPKFSLDPGDTPYNIESKRLTPPQPRTATDATRPKSTPQLPTSNASITLSTVKPTPAPVSLIRPEPVPTNKKTILGDKMKQKEKETINKIKEFIKDKKDVKLNIGDKEAIKITTKILENSNTVDDVEYNVSSFFGSVIDALLYAPALSLSIISTILKYLYSIRNIKKASDIPREIIKNIDFDIKIFPKALVSVIYEFGLRACKGNFKQAFEVSKIIFESIKSETVEIAKERLKNINKEINNAMEQGMEIGRAEGEALAETAQITKSVELEKRIMENQIKYLEDTVIPEFNKLKMSIDPTTIISSFEEYKQFYIKIQKFTSEITTWLRNIGAGNNIYVAPLGELDVAANMPTKKLLENFNLKNFKTVWTKLEKINGLSWDISTDRVYQAELETFSNELKNFILPIIERLRYNR